MFHILVVEDDKNARRLTEAVLKREGYTVHTATNGAHALALMDIQHIDLIILDIMMPEMDGFEFTRELREGGMLTPILMATAKHLPIDKKKRVSGRDGRLHDQAGRYGGNGAPSQGPASPGPDSERAKAHHR